MKQHLLNNVKNVLGWRTKRKIVVISVDDYGNVRLDSSKAREAMDAKGLKVHSRFDALDALENKEDLEYLFEVLGSVKDQHGHGAVFTPFALPCNIDYERMAEEDFQTFRYELLPATYAKLTSLQAEAYNGAWELWQEGMKQGIMVPQFHGREHFNMRVFLEKLTARDEELLTALRHRSYTSISKTNHPNISFTAAYEFESVDENQGFKDILQDGLDQFEKIFGYASIHFNPPGGREHPSIHQYLKEKGVKYLDTPFLKAQHEGNGRYKRVLNWTGKKNADGQTYQVRNVVFEPTDDRGVDWVNYSLQQVNTAFKWKKPAIISSHRVNYGGHINPKNRQKGLEALRSLLQKIVAQHPDVEFMSSVALGDLITAS